MVAHAPLPASDSFLDVVLGLGVMVVFAAGLVRAFAVRRRGRRRSCTPPDPISPAPPPRGATQPARNQSTDPASPQRKPVAEAPEPELARLNAASLAPLARDLSRGRRLGAAEDRVACELAALPDGFWLVERDVVLDHGRIPFLVIGAPGVFVICASDGLVVAMVDQLIEREAERDAADGARRGLVVGVSHDTRTPLTALKLLASAIADEVVDPATQRRYAQEILGHVDGFGVLLDELFEFARLEAGDLDWTMERMAIHELVRETVKGVRPQAEAERLAVVVNLPADLAAVQANPGKVKRVLVNLLQNAIRHTPAAGTISVAATATRSSVEVEVADTGTGIQLADRDRVFEPFFRGADRTDRAIALGQGSGSRSVASSWRRTAAGSGSRTASTGHAFASGLRRADPPGTSTPG